MTPKPALRRPHRNSFERRAALLWLLCLGFACRPSAPTETPRNVLRIATSGDYAPFSADGRGFDIEVAQRLAAALGYTIEWHSFRWPELPSDIVNQRFDLAMSGITWRAQRDLHGYMTRAVALGGPCLLKRPDTTEIRSLAVNHGGILEAWTRKNYADAEIHTTDNNRSLPTLLAAGEVSAIVTDSFELEHFRRDDWVHDCSPARDRKVYWVAPHRADQLGPEIDRWLAEHDAELAALRDQYFGQEHEPRTTEHLIDLLARRLAHMPAVARYKADHGLAIEDSAREAVVLAQVLQRAEAAGFQVESVRQLFREQIEIAKAIQRRQAARYTADLKTELRPALTRLGARIMRELEAAYPNLAGLRLEDLDLLVPWTTADERERLWTALRAVRRVDSGGAATQNLSPAQGRRPATNEPSTP